jgi:hypothetical protein
MTLGRPTSPIFAAMRDSEAEREYAARMPVVVARVGDEMQPVDLAEIARLTGTAQPNDEVQRLVDLAALAAEISPKT